MILRHVVPLLAAMAAAVAFAELLERYAPGVARVERNSMAIAVALGIGYAVRARLTTPRT